MYVTIQFRFHLPISFQIYNTTILWQFLNRDETLPPWGHSAHSDAVPGPNRNEATGVMQDSLSQLVFAPGWETPKNFKNGL
jgi:hypothetical protein